MEGPSNARTYSNGGPYHRLHQDLFSRSIPIGQDADSLSDKLTLSNKLILTLKF